jgi:predicted ATPase
MFIYVDNYRGFTNVSIPIKDVNFLVGENSTGKTSILSIINLFNSVEFWARQEFNNNHVQLGQFKEIISSNSTNNISFKLGYVDQYSRLSGDGKTIINIYGFLILFIEEDGSPIIKEYYYFHNNKLVMLNLNKNRISSYVYDYQNAINNEESLANDMHLWQELANKNKEKFRPYKSKYHYDRDEILWNVKEIIENILKSKIEVNKSALILPEFSQQITWVGPIRSKPKRVYESYKLDINSEDDHTPYIIKRFLGAKKINSFFIDFVNNFGEQSGLFDSIKIKKFGKDNSSPFELDVLINDKSLKISNVGYGVSQILPIIVSIYSRPIGYWFSIQQPEVHLHPKAQAAFGEVIFQLAKNEKKHFLIETHSDYIIDRFRSNINQDASEQKLNSQILFFEKNNLGNQIYPIPINEDGTISDIQPDSYRSFFIHEELKNLGL